MNPPICPICDGFIPNNATPGLYPGALSRRDNQTEICSECGQNEAYGQYFNQGGWEQIPSGATITPDSVIVHTEGGDS